MPVIVVGNACLDTTFRAARLPAPGETVNADDTHEDFGGKGLNQAIAARRAGAEVRLWAAVGDDAAGQAIARRLNEEGIPDADLVRLNRTTDRSTIVVDARGENLIVSDVACARRFDPSAAAAGWRQDDTIVLQGNLTRAVTDKLIALGQARAARVILNASPLRGDEDAARLAVAVLVVNRQEAFALSGFAAPAEAAAALRRRGAEAVVITLGAEGASVCDESGSRAIAGRPVTPVDTSGAGDVFAGVLAAGLDRGLALTQAADWANGAAALATTRRGALAACPTPGEIAACLQPQRRS